VPIEYVPDKAAGGDGDPGIISPLLIEAQAGEVPPDGVHLATRNWTDVPIVAALTESSGAAKNPMFVSLPTNV
jgi:hypothetical protein